MWFKIVGFGAFKLQTCKLLIWRDKSLTCGCHAAKQRLHSVQKLCLENDKKKQPGAQTVAQNNVHASRSHSKSWMLMNGRFLGRWKKHKEWEELWKGKMLKTRGISSAKAHQEKNSDECKCGRDSLLFVHQNFDHANEHHWAWHPRCIWLSIGFMETGTEFQLGRCDNDLKKHQWNRQKQFCESTSSKQHNPLFFKMWWECLHMTLRQMTAWGVVGPWTTCMITLASFLLTLHQQQAPLLSCTSISEGHQSLMNKANKLQIMTGQQNHLSVASLLCTQSQIQGTLIQAKQKCHLQQMFSCNEPDESFEDFTLSFCEFWTVFSGAFWKRKCT